MSPLVRVLTGFEINPGLSLTRLEITEKHFTEEMPGRLVTTSLRFAACCRAIEAQILASHEPGYDKLNILESRSPSIESKRLTQFSSFLGLAVLE